MSLVVEFLRDNDAQCPVCGYQLRGMTAERCSECGTPVHLEIGGPPLGLFLWLAAAFGVALGVGLAAIATVRLFGDVGTLLHDPRRLALVQAGVVSATELPRWWSLVSVTVLLVVLSTLLAWLIASRRRFGRFSRFTKMTLGVIGAMAPLLVLGILRLIIAWSA